MAWQELFGTDIGLFAVFTIGFVLLMGVFFGKYFSRKMDEEAGGRS